MSSKVLIIVGGMVNRLPHVELYLKQYDNYSIKYDIIEWNRHNDSVTEENNRYIYNRKISDLSPFYVKLVEIFKFSLFVKKIIKRNRYNRIITFTIADSLFLIPFLIKKFTKKYIFDIRDYSPLCKLPFFNFILRRFINKSYATCISSNGFKHWLPKGCNYIISHNIDLSLCSSDNKCLFESSKSVLDLLTIGRLRDFESNKIIIDQLSNCNNVKMRFVGDGNAKPLLENYCKKNDCKNVYFYGFYKKEDESSFYNECDFLNICLTDNILSNYLMSNRFYLSVIHRKPMIVNEGSYQAEVCQRYGLGLVVNYKDNIMEKLQSYRNRFDSDLYEKRCNQFIYDVKKEQIIFENIILDFVKS